MRWKRKKRVSIDKTQWHEWFAWHPVSIEHNHYHIFIWGEMVMRKINIIEYFSDYYEPPGYFYESEYKTIGGEDES